MTKPTDLDLMVSAYVGCALWSSTWAENEEDTPRPMDDDYGADDLAEEALREMTDDCESFLNSHRDALAHMTIEQLGHDFWLTRNRHGAGFWDRGLGVLGDVLTRDAHAYESCDLYVGDDGKVWVS